ncbi:MAG: thymidylate synthase [Deltaproteobacteria bacterium]|nr:thymidylate synthase [Deltaproteobacteria bacterium]
MRIHKIETRDLPDLWFQAVHDILDHGRRFKIDRGSYAGQTRLEFDYFIGRVTYPGTIPLIPDIPPSCGIPNPVEHDYIYGGEGYERAYINTEIIDKREVDGQIVFKEDEKLYLNQIEWIIQTYKKFGERNNQMVLQVAQPSDLTLIDPPCLRSIDTRVQDDALCFIVYFRSWDLWNGLPANLAAIQNLKEYMAGEIGVKDGEMIVESKGLHLYGYAEELAKLRCLKE